MIPLKFVKYFIYLLILLIYLIPFYKFNNKIFSIKNKIIYLISYDIYFEFCFNRKYPCYLTFRYIY